jgi:hypothetical protein
MYVCGLCKNHPSCFITNSARFPKLKKQLHVVLLLPYGLCEDQGRFKYNKNKIKFSELVSRQNHLEPCSRRNWSYSKKISQPMLITVLSLGKIFSPITQLRGLPKVRTLKLRIFLLLFSEVSGV